MSRRGLITGAAGLVAGAAAGCGQGHHAPSSAAPHGSSTPASPAAPLLPVPSPAPPTPAPTGPAVEVDHGPVTDRAVALTFHGQGDPALADTLLGTLAAAGGRATVFAVGTWLDQYPQVAAMITDPGHELANHTWHHRAMDSMDGETAYREIAGCADRLREHAGTQGHWFRPSGTAHATPAVLAAAGRAGYRTVIGYDVDPMDHADPGSTAVRNRVLAGLHPGAIVSLHLGHRGTVVAMPAILNGMRAAGLRAVTVSTLLGGD